MIDGLQFHPLKILRDERGSVMHFLRKDVPYYRDFGEVYFSEVLPGAVKGWKRHREMTLNLVVPVGTIELAIHDDRTESSTCGETAFEILSPENYRLATIPPGLWVAFRCVSDHPAILANCADIPHRPDEAENRALDDPDLPCFPLPTLSEGV